MIAQYFIQTIVTSMYEVKFGKKLLNSIPVVYLFYQLLSHVIFLL